MIVSHVDNDHSGGFHAMSGQESEALLLSGTPDRVQQRFQLEYQPRSCHGYPEWTWDGVHFVFLDGTGSGSQSTNNLSCVLHISGYHKALVPGDIESRRERSLSALYGERLSADVLVAPHHGSKSSSSTEFIALVAPEHVVHTQSEANRWGFPHPEVVQRYAAIDAVQYRSGSHGAVVFVSSEQGLSTTFSRRPGQRIWR